MNTQELWQAALGEIELSLSKANFVTWFKSTFILDFDGTNVLIGVPNAFTKAWLENKYNNHIQNALQHITDVPVVHISYKVAVKKGVQKPRTPQRAASVSSSPVYTHAEKGVLQPQSQVQVKTAPEPYPFEKTNLNPKYIFDTFVVGKRNELAQAACKAVTQTPGTIYNPLFIYGGVGLGKTHLMQAVGHEIMRQDMAKRVLYVASETFTNEFIRNIKQGKVEEFKNKYRNTDVLLIDDIQFIAGKEQTQEAFFHTFNHLHQLNKQIVLSSDRLPKEISGLEGRLLSRFEWGMIVDVGAPDFETRLAILKSKCEEKQADLPEDVLTYIATHIQSNIRELEGALNRVIAMQQLNHIDPTLETTKSILSSIISAPKRISISTKQIVDVVCEFFSIKQEDITGDSRKKELVVPRQIAMFLMRKELKSSFPHIGQAFGGRDHTTAIHACEKITNVLESDDMMRQNVILIKERLYN